MSADREDRPPERKRLPLNTDVAIMLTYLLGFVSGLIYLHIENHRENVQFHALQSTIASVAICILLVVLTLVNTAGYVLYGGESLAGTVIGAVLMVVFVPTEIFSIIGAIGLWCYILVQSHRGNHVRIRLPIAADIAVDILY